MTMPPQKPRWARPWVEVMVLSGVLLGCRSHFVALAPRPPQQYIETGRAKGSACGLVMDIYWFLVPATMVTGIFANQHANRRASRAYDEAMRVGMGTALIDTTVTERWYWTPVGAVLCTDVEGTAIREEGR